jgi:hypothetical protein
MTIKPFVMIEYELLEARGFVNQFTGEFVTLIANDKLLYAYIKARLKYFVDERKGEYFDTQEAMADALSMDVKSARKSLQKFIEAGVLVCKKEVFRNYKNWRYSKVHDLVLWKKGKDGNPEILKTEVVKEKPKVQPKPQIPQYEPNWDESDLPF